MPARFAELGDRHAAINEVSHSLQPLLDMYERDDSEGLNDMPYPPDYPKMPGEPKRVQPSRDAQPPEGLRRLASDRPGRSRRRDRLG